MPADAYYWNSVDFDSDESISNTFPRPYVDPWDLENYAYIRDQLDSLEVSSEPSSFGEPVEATSSFYYAPARPKSYSPKDKKKYDSLLESEYGTAKYAEIEDVYGETHHIPRQKVREPKPREVEDIYGIAAFGLESDEEEIPYQASNRKFSTTFYESAPQHSQHRPAVAIKRRMSYSYGDYGYGQYNSPPSLYSRLEGRRAESARPTPIYDDVRINRFKPNNFGLSNYGHLQIDYSCSWNNLDKYIYN